MYKPLSHHIKQHMNKGYVVIPTELETVKIPKVSFNSFLVMDYRYSNNENVTNDSETIVSPYEENVEHKSNYLMGFAVIKNISFLDELSNISIGSMSRIRRKITETISRVVSSCEVPRNRGYRSAYVEREFNGYYSIPSDDIMESLGIDPSSAKEYLVVPFFISTTVYFNNFRAKTGVGNNISSQSLVHQDINRRLPIAMSDLVNKINRRLPKKINESLLSGIILASPEHIIDDSPYMSSIMDYANEKVSYFL